MMKNTRISLREIPRDQWEDFLRTFSGAYRHQPITVDIGLSGALRRVHHDVPLRSMALRLRTSEADCIALSFGGDANLTEVVRRFATPARLRVYVRPDNGYEALEIHGNDGESLWVRLPAKVLPIERRTPAAMRR
jgi:hypothetical protein